MKKILIYFILFISSIHLYGQYFPKEILKRSYEFISSQKSVTYSVKGRQKYFNEEDTLICNGIISLLKQPQDSIFGGYIWIMLNDSLYKFYTISKIYSVNKYRKTAIIYDMAKGEDWAINGNIGEIMIWRFFLNPKKILSMMDSSNKLALLNDTVINGKMCYKISVKMPDEETFSDQQMLIFINKKDFVPIMTKYKIKFQGNYQYTEFHIISYSFNNVKESKFSSTQIPLSYKINTYHESQNDSFAFLVNGTIAPSIKGMSYLKGLQNDSINYMGKITLLDFWYMSCYPCILAIPTIEKIKEKYKDKNFQIYGIDNYDNNDKGIKKMHKFIENNPLHYSVFFVEKSIIEDYKIIAWPTFYIIDVNGRVIYSKCGYSETMFGDLATHIDSLIK